MSAAKHLQHLRELAAALKKEDRSSDTPDAEIDQLAYQIVQTLIADEVRKDKGRNVTFQHVFRLKDALGWSCDLRNALHKLYGAELKDWFFGEPTRNETQRLHEFLTRSEISLSWSLCEGIERYPELGSFALAHLQPQPESCSTAHEEVCQ